MKHYIVEAGEKEEFIANGMRVGNGVLFLLNTEGFPIVMYAKGEWWRCYLQDAKTEEAE